MVKVSFEKRYKSIHSRPGLSTQTESEFGHVILTETLVRKLYDLDKNSFRITMNS